MLSLIREKADVFFHSGKTGEGRRLMSGLGALYRKEMADHIRSRRFLIVLCLILLTSFASVYGAVSVLSDAVASDSDYIFLKLFTLSGNSIPSFTSFIALLGPFVGLTLGFDAINSERSEGTLNRLVSQPIYRDSVIIGKFLAGATVIFAMLVVMVGAVSALGILATGIHPGLEEVGRILVFLIFTGVYICFWLGLSILFSVLCRHSATSALAVIACWMFFTIFLSLLAGMIAAAMYPLEGLAGLFNMADYYSTQLAINRLSPYYLYGEAVTTILNPGVRTTGLVTNAQLEGAIAGYLPFGQSLLLVWPQLVGMAALTLAVFAIAYVKFMRQEVRAS